MNQWEGIIIGASVAAVATVLVTNWINKSPVGGAAGAQPAVQANQNYGQNPQHPLYVVDLDPTPAAAAPVAQVNPNTEAAYNVQGAGPAGVSAYAPAFGTVANQPAEELVLPA
jgi:hypothetical protein